MSRAIDAPLPRSVVCPYAHATLTEPELQALLDLIVILDATPADYLHVPEPHLTHQALRKLGLAIDQACQQADEHKETSIFLSISTTKCFF